MLTILRRVPVPGHIAFFVGSVKRVSRALITGIVETHTAHQRCKKPVEAESTQELYMFCKARESKMKEITHSLTQNRERGDNSFTHSK